MVDMAIPPSEYLYDVNRRFGAVTGIGPCRARPACMIRPRTDMIALDRLATSRAFAACHEGSSNRSLH